MPTHDMEDYDGLRERFEWADVFEEADWNAPDELNVAHEVCDRHPDEDVALEYAGVDGERETLTFSDLAERSNRFANVLDGLVERSGVARSRSGVRSENTLRWPRLPSFPSPTASGATS